MSVGWRLRGWDVGILYRLSKYTLYLCIVQDFLTCVTCMYAVTKPTSMAICTCCHVVHFRKWHHCWPVEVNSAFFCKIKKRKKRNICLYKNSNLKQIWKDFCFQTEVYGDTLNSCVAHLLKCIATEGIFFKCCKGTIKHRIMLWCTHLEC